MSVAEDCFYLSKNADPDVIVALYGISSGSSVCERTCLGVSSIQRVKDTRSTQNEYLSFDTN